jgi:hypothetical protein
MSIESDEQEPVGFGLYGANGDREFQILVPLELLEQLEDELAERLKLQALEIKRRREEQYAAAKLAEQARLNGASASNPTAGPSALARSQTPLQAAQALQVPQELPTQPLHTVSVFDWDAAQERFDALKNRPAVTDKDAVARDLRHFAQAMAHGPWRSAARPLGWREELQLLATEMPNFAQVVQAVQRSLALAELSGRPTVLQPILLLGSPGVGKTYFTQRLAQVLQTPIHRQAFDSPQTNATLRGTDRHWSTSAAGALWQLVVLGKSANPVVLLDELDKGAHTGGSHRPVDALLSLLEPVTAAKVRDVSVDFEFDASYVAYVATANDAKSISAPLRSRFLEFFIEEPDIEGRLTLAHSIFETTMGQMLPQEQLRARFGRPSNLQVCRLAWKTPREIRMAVERALGAAAYAQRFHFEDEDFDVPAPRVDRTSVTRRHGDDEDPRSLVVG